MMDKNKDKDLQKKSDNKDIKNKKKSEPSVLKEKNSEINLLKKQEEKVQELEMETINLKDDKLRILAEMENLRKRVEKERIESVKYGSSKLAKEILSPLDNLSRALESLSPEEKNDEKNKGLINGLTMVHQEILTILEKNGVKKIEALDKKFDHNYHQAMMEIETSDKENGIVIKELQAGYTMNDRLLRPSMVGVSKKKVEDSKK
tara:strand:+ start:16691 stop:17305 length:615 start_codon:yes stop_codon:yes gene_type:complete